MAEKEERIICRVIENGYDCDYCIPTEGYQYRQCSISNYDCMYDRYGQCSLGMTRARVIEKMAKAIKSVPKASGEAVHSTDYQRWAEAALNALLGKE